MRKTGKKALSFVLSVLMVVSLLPTISFAKTGNTPITAFWADDRAFIEGDMDWGDPDNPQYNLEFTDYTVETDDGESKTGPMWDIIGWLTEKYPDTEFDADIDWDRTEDPRGGTVGDRFTIVYNLDGFETEWTLTIVDNPIESVETAEVVRYEGDTYEENGYNDEYGVWHDEKWQKYDFSPYFKVTLMNGQEYEDRNCWEVQKWIKEQTGLILNIWWDDNPCQNPPKGIGIGEYTVPCGLGVFSDVYKAKVVANPVESVEVLSNLTLLEGDKETRNEYWDETIGEIVHKPWEAYPTWPEKIRVTVTGQEKPFEGYTNDVIDSVAEALGISRNELGHGDANDDQSPSNPWGKGVHHERFEINGCSADYDVNIIDNPVASIEVEKKTVFEGSQREETGYWGPDYEDPDVKWLKYDCQPDVIHVVMTNGETFDGRVDQAYDFVYKKVNTDFRSEWRDDQSPDNPWGKGDYEVEFRFAGRNTGYTVCVVENPIQSIGVEDKIVYLGETREESEYDGKPVKWQRYDCWPKNMSVLLKSGQEVAGDPNKVHDDLKEIFGFDFEFGDRNDGQSPYEEAWTIGVHPVEFVCAGSKTTYNVRVIEPEAQSVGVEDLIVFYGDTEPQEGYWGPGGDNPSIKWERYRTWPQNISVELKDGTKYNGDPGWVYDQASEKLGHDFDFGDRNDGQNPYEPWGVGDHPVDFVFAGAKTTYNVRVVESSVQSVTVTDMTAFEGSARQEHEYEGQPVEAWMRYDTFPGNIKVVLKDGSEYEGDPHYVYDQVSEKLGYHFDWGDRNDGQSPTNQWEPGHHQVDFVFAGVWTTYDINIVANPILSVEILEEGYLIEGDTHIEHGYWYDDRWVEDDWEKYSPSPGSIKVTLDSTAVVSGSANVFAGDLWMVKEQVAEALGREPYEIRVEIYDDQVPGQLWEPGDYKCILSFGGSDVSFIQNIIPFPVASVSVGKKEVTSEDLVDNLDRYIDFETGEETYDVPNFEGYNAWPEIISVKLKNGMEVTGETETVHEQIMELMKQETGLEGRCVFFPAYEMTDQRPDAPWGEGKHQAKYRFGYVSTTYEVEVLHEHQMKFVKAKDATCTKAGNKAHYECTTCEKWFEDEEATKEIKDHDKYIIPATGHKWSDWYVTKEPTPDKTGVKEKVCEYCGTKKTATIPKIEKKTVPLTLKVGATGVDISWKAVDYAAKYRIFKKNAKGNWAKLDTVTTLSYTDTTVKLNEKATYSVLAMTSSGVIISEYGNGKSITYTAPPTAVTAKYKTTGVNLTWKAYEGASKYRVFRKVGDGAWTKLTTVTKLTYEDTTAVYGKTYLYSVRAMDAKGSFLNDYGDGVSITYFAPTPKVTLENTDKGIAISWATVTGAAKYRIFVKNASGTWTKLATVKDATTYTDTTAKDGKSYTYTVVGLDSAGRLMNDYGTGKTIKRVVPKKVMDITLKSVAAGVKISWKAYDGAGKYRVFRKNAEGNWDMLATVKEEGVLYYRDTTAVDGETYTYTVVAMTSGGTAISDQGDGESITYVKPVSDIEAVEATVTDEEGNTVVIISDGDETSMDIIEVNPEEAVEETEEAASEDTEDGSEDIEAEEEISEDADAEEVISEDAEAVEISGDAEAVEAEETVETSDEDAVDEEAAADAEEVAGAETAEGEEAETDEVISE